MQHRKRHHSGKPRKNANPQQPLYAALDLGTNNCRMLIARRTPQGFYVVDSFSRITRLGEDITQSGRLSQNAMDRTIKALQICAKKMETRNVKFVRSVATEACRRAENAQEFLNRVEKEAGIQLEAISPEEEAGLALTGCASLLNLQKPRGLVFDIGGGSTEIMWIEFDRLGDPVVSDVISLPIGVVTISESYATNNEIDGTAYQAIIDHVSQALEKFEVKNAILKDVEAGRVQMLGTSGTVTTLGAVHLQLPRYMRSKVDGMNLSFERVDSISRKLTAMDCEQRAAHPCIGENRADLVVAGCAILDAVCQLWPVGELTIADRGIREGILLKLMRAQERAKESA